MPPRHRRSYAVAGRQRRKLVWATFDQTLASLTFGQRQCVNLLATLSVAGSSLLGVTIMRTHLRFTTTCASLGDSTSYGLIVGRVVDVGPGVGPDPNADSELDWMLLSRTMANTMGSGATVVTTELHNVDIRSRRKMPELGQAYLFALHNNNAAAAETIRVFGRTLVALP